MTASWKWISGAAVAAGVVVAIVLARRSAPADQVKVAEPVTIRFAYQKVLDPLPFFVAEKEGYLKDEGIVIEHIVLNNGPAVVSALTAGSADIGFSATMPLMMAREAHLPLQAFAALDWETPPTEITTVLLARESSGISDPKGLAGKTLAINTTAGQCELLTRVQLRKAGIPYESVKIVSIPFPQMAPALELGTVDAVCTVDPFRTSMIQSAIKGKSIGSGLLLEDAPKVPYVNTVLYGKEEWLTAHRKDVTGLVRALDRAAASIKHDPAKARQILGDTMKLAPGVADAVRIGIGERVTLRPENLQPVVDSAFAVGMIKTKLDVKELTFVVSP